MSAGLECAAVRLAVDAARHAADDDEPCARRGRPPNGARRATPYAEQARAPTTATAGRASSVNRRSRGGRDRAAGRRSTPGGGKPGERGSQRSPRAGAVRCTPRSSKRAGEAPEPLRPWAPVRLVRRSRPQAARRARSSPPAPWRAVARAPRPRAPAPTRPRLRARRPCGPPGRPAPGRAPEAASARPRGEQLVRLRVARQRQVPRAAPGPRDPLARRRGRLGRPRQLVGARSRDGDDEVEPVEQRPRELVAKGTRAAAASTSTRARGSPRAPHGHRFIVATSWKRAGKTARPSARATPTRRPRAAGAAPRARAG